MSRRLLVIAPHADDAELGCGGYISKRVTEGAAVKVAVVTVGDIYFAHLSRIVTSAERGQEIADGMADLGVSDYEILLPGQDGVLDAHPISNLVQRIDHLQGSFRPTEMLIPLPSSHQDHSYVYKACVAATRPSAFNKNMQLVAAYEYPASGWGDGSSFDSGKGGMYVDLNEYHMSRKLSALRKHKSQSKDGRMWGAESASALARMRGCEIGCDYAELFHVMRFVVR